MAGPIKKKGGASAPKGSAHDFSLYHNRLTFNTEAIYSPPSHPDASLSPRVFIFRCRVRVVSVSSFRASRSLPVPALPWGKK